MSGSNSSFLHSILQNPKIIQTKETTKIAPELSRITYFHAEDLRSFEESFQFPTNFMHSFGESKARKVSKYLQQRSDWIEYNKTHMSRIYPSGNRVDSSNFNPIAAWTSGVQMVSLNIQTPDGFMRMNDGRFRENGNCGYVLKPSLEVPKEGAETGGSMTLSVRVICASCIPKPKADKKGEIISPYVQVCCYDIMMGHGKEIYSYGSSTPAHLNGFNPTFQSRNSHTFKIQHQNVAMLQFTVLDKGDVIIGSASIPVSCIREGYRSVKLFDTNNIRTGAFESASLLVRVKIKRGMQEVKMW